MFAQIRDPELRATIRAAYLAWKRTAQQLELFDEALDG